MTLPRLTAEAALAAPLGVYATGGRGTRAADSAATAAAAASGVVAPMGLLDGLFGGGPGGGLLSGLGGLLGQVAGKIPCLIGCGLPNAAQIALTCGIDPACWIAQGTEAGAGCISQCFSS